ncbi:MAG: AmmeMemoRadiSam system protein B [Planctomycetota bacterium]|jgi:AmmeMemoRadiSam system protein B
MSPRLESLPTHIRTPDLRPIQPIPATQDGKKLVALRDPSMLSQQTLLVPPPVMTVLQQFSGTDQIEAIAERMNGNLDQFIDLAEGLDRVGLLWGPTFSALEEERLEGIRSNGAFPGGAALAMGESVEECRTTMNEWFEQTEDPELDGEIVGLVAPHLDYERGWPNYAAAYYLAREMPTPDRVVVLGTNHFGLGDGVVGTEWGFDSPMGRINSDEAVTSALRERLGRPYLVDQLDHLAEHSIVLQLPWIQYCFGDVPIVPALIPDPINQPEDDERVSGESFIDALSATLDDVGGRTFFVASSDLSHVGPQFGEPRPVDDQRRHDVEAHDREMLGHVVSCDTDAFVSAMRWSCNPTRWCSIGSMAAALQLARPGAVELIDYRQAVDERGLVLVSSAALVMQ